MAPPSERFVSAARLARGRSGANACSGSRVVRRLDGDVRKEPVEPARDVPGLLAEPGEERRNERHLHDQCVRNDRDCEQQAELLRDAVRREDEGREDRAHDERGRHDHAPDRGDAVLDRFAVLQAVDVLLSDAASRKTM